MRRMPRINSKQYKTRSQFGCADGTGTSCYDGPMKLSDQSLILGAVLAGTIALPPSSCSAKALFEWPGSKKAKASTQPAAASEPVPQPVSPVQSVVPKPPADPDWPEIDLNTLAKPKEKISPVKKLWPLARKAKSEAQPTTEGAPESQSQPAVSTPEKPQNSLQETAKHLATPVNRATKQDPDWPEIESEPKSTGDSVNRSLESSSQTNAQTDLPPAQTATKSDTSVKTVKTKPVTSRAPQLIPQSTTTSAFNASAAHSLALREVSKAVHVHKTPTTERIIIATDSLFDRDLATITPTGELVLNKLVAGTEKWKEHPVFIECHSDNFGFDTFIRKLTQQRADCVRQWFVKRDLLQDVQAKAVGVGKDKPLVPNQKNGRDDREAMAINRRLEIYVDKTKAVEVPVISQEPEVEPDMGGQQPQQTASNADSQNPGGHDPSFGDASSILDKLPRLEDLDPHAGRTRDYTTEKEKMPERDSPEKIREHEWEQKEFGLWRERD